MLMPRKAKHRKQQRGRLNGMTKGGESVTFGDFGIQAMEPAWITARQIEAARIAMTRHVKRGGKVWIRVFPDKPVTQKPAETRMGSGKGNPEHWVAVVASWAHPVRARRRGRGTCTRRHGAGDPEAPDEGAFRDAARRRLDPGGAGLMTTGAELRELDDDELDNRLTNARKELFNLRFQPATGRLDNSARTGAVRRDIARMLTVIRARELAGRSDRCQRPDHRAYHRWPAPPPERGGVMSDNETTTVDEPSAEAEVTQAPASPAVATPKAAAAESTEARENRRKVREGLVVSTADGQDRRRGRDRARPAPSLRQDRAAHAQAVRARRGERGLGRRPRPCRTRRGPYSKTKRWRLVEVLERAR